jgi:hypothetical protein
MKPNRSPVGPYIADILRDTPVYRRRWLARPALAGGGRLHDGLCRASVARCVFEELDDQNLLDDLELDLPQITWRVYAFLSGKSSNARTLQWILETFDMDLEHREQAWVILAEFPPRDVA